MRKRSVEGKKKNKLRNVSPNTTGTAESKKRINFAEPANTMRIQTLPASRNWHESGASMQVLLGEAALRILSPVQELGSMHRLALIVAIRQQMASLEGLAIWVFKMEPMTGTAGSQATVLMPVLQVLGVRENTQSGKQTGDVAEFMDLVDPAHMPQRVMLLILPHLDILLLIHIAPLQVLIHRHPTCEVQMLSEVEQQTVAIPLLILLLIHILARLLHTHAQLLPTQPLLRHHPTCLVALWAAEVARFILEDIS